MKCLSSIAIFILAAALSVSANGRHYNAPPGDTALIKPMLEKGQTLVVHWMANAAQIDSAIELAQKTLQLSRDRSWLRGQAESWLILAYASDKKYDTVKSLHYLDSALTLSNQINWWQGLGNCTLLKASSLQGFDSIRIMQRITLEKEALAYGVRAADSLLIARCYDDLGEDYQLLKAYDKTTQTLDRSNANYKQALAYFGSAYCPEVQDSYWGLTVNSFMTGDYDESISWCQRAITLGETHHDTTLLMTAIYNHQGLNYATNEDFHIAILYGRKGLELASKLSDTGWIYICSANIANALGKLGQYDKAIAILKKAEKAFPSGNRYVFTHVYYRYIDIYTSEGRPDLARPYALYFLHTIREPPGDANLYKLWYLGVSRYFSANKEYERALQFLSKYSAQRMRLDANSLLQVYQEIYQADSALGRSGEALAAHVIFKNFSDSLFNEKKTKQIAFLNIQFESLQKDRQLLLQRQQLQLEEAGLEKSQTDRKLYMYLAIGLLLVTGLLIGLFRLKVTKNRALTLQQAIINGKNVKLEQLLREKDWLLKEVHHRVKNNLQIVISLLNSQSTYIGEGAALEAIQDSQARVHSIAMIHQKLYTSTSILSIDLQDYFTDLVNYFRSAYTAPRQTEFLLDLSQARVDVSVAVPLALILNEAITNALKHAFRDGRPGTIRIWMRPINTTEHEIGIADNGIGFSDKAAPEYHSSMGMNLITGLTEDIGGSCLIENNNGVTIRIIFTNTHLDT